MKKAKYSKLFLEELSKTPIVSSVCKKLNISRNSVYRWIKEDKDFEEQYNLCISQGIDSINDLAESKLISKINEGQMRAIIFWLENNKDNYRKPKLPLLRDYNYKGITEFIIGNEAMFEKYKKYIEKEDKENNNK